MKTCALVVRIENMLNPVNSKCKWREDDLLIVEEYTRRGDKILKDFGYTNINRNEIG